MNENAEAAKQEPLSPASPITPTLLPLNSLELESYRDSAVDNIKLEGVDDLVPYQDKEQPKQKRKILIHASSAPPDMLDDEVHAA